MYRQYNYDPVGELISLLDKARGKIEYNYDKNGQLKTVTTRNRQEQFIADASGNFLPSQVLPSKYLAKHNRITDYGHIHIKYDV
nr:hypothetical protein [Gilliamella apicola]